MSIYTVFAPPPRNDEAADPERFRFVRDGFLWGAFVFGPLWMLWHRLWLVLAGYAVLMAVLGFGLWKIDASGAVEAAAGFFVALLIGFEASSLRRWTLRRRGWEDIGIVVGDDRDSAERRFFQSWIDREVMRKEFQSTAIPSRNMPSVRAPEVVGLFPEPGGGR